MGSTGVRSQRSADLAQLGRLVLDQRDQSSDRPGFTGLGALDEIGDRDRPTGQDYFLGTRMIRASP